MAGRQVLIHLRAAPEQVLAQIRSTTGTEGLLFSPDWHRKDDIISRIRGNKVRLRTRQYRERRPIAFGYTRYFNSWAPFFFGQIQQANGGSTISGRIDLHPSLRLFERFYALFVGLALVFGGIVPLAAGNVSGNTVGLAVIPWVMWLGLALIRTYGRLVAQEDELTLVAFLDDLAAKLSRAG